MTVNNILFASYKNFSTWRINLQIFTSQNVGMKKVGSMHSFCSTYMSTVYTDHLCVTTVSKLSLVYKRTPKHYKASDSKIDLKLKIPSTLFFVLIENRIHLNPTILGRNV